MDKELTRSQIEARMEEVELDIRELDDLDEWIERYLRSHLVGASNIGRHYAVSDPQQREDFAVWFVGVLERALRYRKVMEQATEVRHIGGGWYQVGDQRVRGREAALAAAGRSHDGDE